MKKLFLLLIFLSCCHGKSNIPQQPDQQPVKNNEAAVIYMQKLEPIEKDGLKRIYSDYSVYNNDFLINPKYQFAINYSIYSASYNQYDMFSAKLQNISSKIIFNVRWDNRIGYVKIDLNSELDIINTAYFPDEKNQFIDTYIKAGYIQQDSFIVKNGYSYIDNDIKNSTQRYKINWFNGLGVKSYISECGNWQRLDSLMKIDIDYSTVKITYFDETNQITKWVTVQIYSRTSYTIKGKVMDSFGYVEGFNYATIYISFSFDTNNNLLFAWDTENYPSILSTFNRYKL